MRPNRILVPVAMLVCLLGGCSFLATSGPGARYKPRTQPNCDTSRLAPTIDTVMAIAGATFALEMSSEDSTALGLGIMTGLMWGTGALAGFSNNSDCRKARARHHRYTRKLELHGTDDPWELPPNRAKPRPGLPKQAPIHSKQCKRWRARVFAAPVGKARLAVIEQMPRECHE